MLYPLIFFNIVFCLRSKIARHIIYTILKIFVFLEFYKSAILLLFKYYNIVYYFMFIIALWSKPLILLRVSSQNVTI